MTFGRKKKAPGFTVNRPAYGYDHAARQRYEINVNIMLDVSSSMPKEGVRYMMEHGFKSIMQTLKGFMGLDFHYNIRIVVFGSEVRELLPFTSVDEAIERVLPAVEPRGVTRTEDAMRDAIKTIKQLKKEQDNAHLKRGSSVCIIVTDGMPTDEKGHRQPLDPDLVREIALLNETRSLVTFAVGFGDANESVLSQLAPSEQAKLPDGTTVPFAHAVRFDGNHDESGERFWQQITQLVGLASSSTSTIGGSGQIVVGLAYHDADLPETFRNVSLIDPSLDVQLIY